MLKGYQKLCIRRCPLNNTGVYHSPHWDIVGMDITPCDITCITGVISNTVILHMAVMIRLYATILPFPVILRRRIKPEDCRRGRVCAQTMLKVLCGVMQFQFDIDGQRATLAVFLPGFGSIFPKNRRRVTECCPPSNYRLSKFTHFY